MASPDVDQVSRDLESLKVAEMEAKTSAEHPSKIDRRPSPKELRDKTIEEQRLKILQLQALAKQVQSPKPKDMSASTPEELRAREIEKQNLRLKELQAIARQVQAAKPNSKPLWDAKPAWDVKPPPRDSTSTPPKEFQYPKAPKATREPKPARDFRSREDLTPLQTKRPTPSPFYIQKAERPAKPQLDRPRSLLVILDLNGTLLHRQKRGGDNSFIARPNLDSFLDYLFDNHRVMIWASSRPENVHMMCERLFTPEQLAEITAIWGRDKLHLSPKMYKSKVKIYKQLSWVWEDRLIQARDPLEKWCQTNTVLIDDNRDKGASEPYNVMEVDNFEATAEQMKDKNSLDQVVDYLEILRWQRDVSVYMKSQPFSYTSSLRDSRPVNAFRIPVSADVDEET